MTRVHKCSYLLLGLLMASPAALFGQANPPAKKAMQGKSSKSAAKSATASSDPALMNPASMKGRAPDTFKVHFNTTAGPITVEVTRAWSPLGADRFYNLSRHHFFDGAAFFRVVPGFVVQFGLPANPKVSQVWAAANIKDDAVTQSNHRGSLTFATAGANTRTTQLFINLGENVRLDKMGFSPFGTVVEGMDVVDKIYSGYGEKPDQDLITKQGKAYLDKNFPKLDRIVSATVEGGPAPAAPAKAPAKSPAKKAPAKKTPTNPTP